MVFNNYDKDISESKIENNGHTIQMTPKPQSFSKTNAPPTISGGEWIQKTFYLKKNVPNLFHELLIPK